MNRKNENKLNDYSTQKKKKTEREDFKIKHHSYKEIKEMKVELKTQENEELLNKIN